MKNLKFIDLCAGIGGFRYAFDKSAECVLTCEIDKFASQTYHANFEDNNWSTDIKKIDPTEIQKFDILCAGFPCQAFSLAGKQAGFLDTRGTIFFDIVRIAKEKRPPVLFLENVKNLRSHDKGNTFKIIQKNLDDLNYWHKDYLINAQYFVPQKRQRIYIVALRKDLFSEDEFKSLCIDIENKYEKKQQLPLPKFQDILEKEVSAKYTLSDKLWSFLQSHATKHNAKGNGFGFGLMKKTDTTSRTLTARYYKDGSEVLIEQDNKNPRKLTPREAARLMGYPEDYKIVVSDTQAYKQFGNSVVVPVIEMIAESLLKCLKKK
jgi:DNA (cytosine-5)-methyltransferase 1